MFTTLALFSRCCVCSCASHVPRRAFSQFSFSPLILLIFLAGMFCIITQGGRSYPRGMLQNSGIYFIRTTLLVVVRQNGKNERRLFLTLPFFSLREELCLPAVTFIPLAA